MKWLELEEADLAARGGLATAREIEGQPACWRETLSLLGARQAQAQEFLAPLLATPGIRIILTGAGTSAYIGQCLLPVLLERTHARVEAIATTDLLSAPRAWLQADVPTLLVSFARSGGSPESLAAVDIADRQVPGVHHLVITCNATGALYRACERRARTLALALPESTHDAGFAMTASFTSMLYAGLALLGGHDAARAGLEATCRAGERTLHQHVPALRELAQRPLMRAVFLGSGPHTGLAHEAALKVMELSDGAVATFGNSPLGFRHGPKAIVKRDTLVVMFVAAAELARRYDLDLLRELAGDAAAGALLAVSNQPDPRLPGVQWLEVAAPGVADDAQLMLPYVMCAQAYAVHRSLALGRRPDSPSVSGTVNRVVRGVTVHEVA